MNDNASQSSDSAALPDLEIPAERPTAKRDGGGAWAAFGAPFVMLSPRLPKVSLLVLLLLLLNVTTVIGVVYFIFKIDNSRDQLIEVRIDALKTQAGIIAGALSESAIIGEDELTIDYDRANLTIRRLVDETKARARLYTASGRLLADSRLLNRSQVETFDLAPIGENTYPLTIEDRVYNFLVKYFFMEELPPYREYANQPGTDYPEVIAALDGQTASARRENIDQELVFSVAVPVRHLQIVRGALLVSAEGGDIDALVRENRMTILKIVAIGVVASAALTLVLFFYIASPLRRLSRTAEDATTGTNFARVEIPDMSWRRDEIGELSLSLRTMMGALYSRIEAIESFAADVSHEIKNPLTSIRSAVETLELAKNNEARTMLMDLIQQDVSRLDRLISDISDASRLDAELARERSETVIIGKLLEGLVAIYQGTRKDTDPHVKLRFKERLPGDGAVLGIESRVGQVFRNLINNAISFSDSGAAIDISVDRYFRQNKEYIRIFIDDEGPGIPEDNLDTIFNRFYTERPEAEGFGNNSGLGLSISRQIVEAHEGEIWAENKTGNDGGVKGARFVILFPTQKSREAFH